MTAAVSVANAPVSFGVFEITAGGEDPLPDPERLLTAISDAGYAGTELGPPSYLGDRGVLRQRLEASGLRLVGGFVPMRFSQPEYWEEDLKTLTDTLDLFAAAGSTDARPVLADAGGPERRANPGAGGQDASLRLDNRRWRALVSGVQRAADTARGRGYTPVFHHHTSTYIEGIPEIERFLEDTDVTLLLDTGHLLIAGGDPITALREWADRVAAIHIKDVRLDVLEAVRAERRDMLAAWQRGLFCALGDGDAELREFCAELDARDYEGWVVVEQDRVLQGGSDFELAVADQRRNREWLREHAGW